jgi:twitching motility two-component system response regulator PilH
MLVQDGYGVLKAADGETAIETAQSQLPELVFLDIVLPGISGFAVLRSLRRDSRTRATPIIMMSGNQQATEQFYLQRYGADDFMKKPFDRDDVYERIGSLVAAGRLPARDTSVAENTLLSALSAEALDGIPDIAMPDAGTPGTTEAPLPLHRVA